MIHDVPFNRYDWPFDVTDRTLFFRVSAIRYNVEEEKEEEEENKRSIREHLTECKIKLTFALTG